MAKTQPACIYATESQCLHVSNRSAYYEGLPDEAKKQYNAKLDKFGIAVDDPRRLKLTGYVDAE